MTAFDAIAHSYTTVSTSGFSTHNDSMGYFSTISPWIEWIAILFMILGSLNFTLHYLALHHFTLKVYWQDIQARVFMGFVLLLIFLTMLGLLFYEIPNKTGLPQTVTDNVWDAFRFASFQIVSIISTTGYTTENFSAWPPVLAVLVFSSGFIGGCVGSTAGGFKIIRIILLYKQGLREIYRLIHPSAVNTMRIQGKAVSERVIETVLGFTFLYFASYVFLSIALLAVTDLSAFDAFVAMAACINTIGPGLGEVANHFAAVSDMGLWLCSFAMILGRLEIFALLVVLMPAFWRQ
jgi:trk system potassium uptake protein TrkH